MRISSPTGRSHRFLNLRWLRTVLTAMVLAMSTLATGTARAGLTMELHFYRQDNGGTYSFYAPLLTNAIGPAAPLGTYVILSPHQPTNGSVRAFQLTAGGMQDLNFADSENFYSDFNSAIFQITNGTWTLQFTNASTTNIFHFNVTASALMTSNMLPASYGIFPANQSTILTTDTNFAWVGPTSWPGTFLITTYNQDGYYMSASLPMSQTNWAVDSMLPTNQNYSLFDQCLYTNTLFTVTTPTDSVSSQPFAGWSSYNVLDTGFSLSFSVVASHGIPTVGHTLLANYTFEDNNLFVHDFAGGNDMSYAWFTVPPSIVTNDAAAGIYAGGLGGSGWFVPPDGLKPLFEKSFSVSLWVKTINVFGNDDADLDSSAGIVSDLGNDYNNSAAPMLQSGHKLGFYTGGDFPNVLRSHADITTGQYIHLVTTRDQQTGQKCLYVNGVLDATIFASTNVLESSSNGDLTIGFNNTQVFKGQVDEIQFYAGVLSSNDVALLHAHPGTNISDVLQLQYPVGRYDFEDTNTPGADTSGHNNTSFCYGYYTNRDFPSSNAIVGNLARNFPGDSWICFNPDEFPAISNALTGDFTVTAWVNTTNSFNSDAAPAEYGMPVFYAFSESTNGTVPISITGSKAAFCVANTNGTDTTIHSVTSVNDGKYHFIAVTRTRSSGLMSLYVDGLLEASAIGNKAFIRPDVTMYIGTGSGINYNGLLDDVRIYGGTMSPNDISTLAANGALTFANALGTTNIQWNTSSNAQWFVETTNTYNGANAALQSGSITGNQTSAITAIVTGPGILNFAWQNPTVNNLDLEFDLDGSYIDDIGSFTDWTLEAPIQIPAGRHTLSWTAYASGDSDPNEAAFLGQVAFNQHSLVAHFDFESTTAFPPLDVSSNGNDITYQTSYNGGATFLTNNAAAGSQSLCFARNPTFSFSGGIVSWTPATPPDLLQTLAGSFSVSLWIKTTNHDGNVGDTASAGTPIVSSDVPNDARDVTPVALTGGAVAFGTGGTPGDDTLTSAKLVNDNHWHHIVVTRDEISGQKRIFIDGVEDSASPGQGINGLLNAPQLLGIGVRFDASHTDALGDSIYTAGYEGLLDDLQIYNRPLTSDEVAFLYGHPGQEVNTLTQGPVAYDVAVRFEFHGGGGYYYMFPIITSVNPPPALSARITSPNGNFVGSLDGSGSSEDFTSLNDIVQECNGTNWLLLIDEASANPRELRFSMTVSGLDTSKLPPVTIYTPADGSVNVTTNPVFTWSGPATFQGLNVVAATPVLQNFSAFLDPATVTNWTSPKLSYGTNQFFVNYSNTFSTVTISTPVDTTTGQSLSNWVAGAGVYASAASTFIVGAPAPLPVHMASIHHDSASFQFSFTTLAGRPHILQGRTNLTAGSWVNITNFIGDGSDAQFTIPNTNLLKYFRVVTQ